tara:strand:+ start:1378 stop:1830 length:453 start_codon:yes stop_codon:yes gene_type:complete
MQKNLIAGFRHTGIITKDIKKSFNFYGEILGMEMVQEFTDSSDYINEITNLKNCSAHFIKLKMADGTILELLEYPTHPTEEFDLPIINVGLCHIALRVEDIDFMYEHLQKNNITVLSKPVLSSEKIAKVFFCLDPDGVRVEIVEMLNFPE